MENDRERERERVVAMPRMHIDYDPDHNPDHDPSPSICGHWGQTCYLFVATCGAVAGLMLGVAVLAWVSAMDGEEKRKRRLRF